jgi:CheY-like chemotaxis protein
MINDTLDLSMIESGALRLSPRALVPAELLQATLPLVDAAAQRHEVRLMPPEIDPDVGAAWGDETRVRQILTNLLSNAVKYNVRGGQVQVRVSRPGPGQVAFAVRDTGLGMSPAQIEGLFQPFNRLGRETTPVEGTGIGLVISRRLAELMGGRLELHSRVGEGSTFVLTLPAVSAGARDADAARAVPGRDTAGDYHRRRVLYVEDNETNIVLMQGMLAQRPQIELSVARLGLDALAAVRQGRPLDLILLDMHLPDMDGLDLLRQLKQDPVAAEVPVLVLSADATRERIESAVREGAAGYLPKPIELSELLAEVDAILEQRDTRWG